MASRAVVRVDGLVKRYGTTVAVDGISFTVAEGEVFGLLGPNGAGKTTTLEILEGLRRPDAGEVEVAGHSVVRAPQEVRASIGVQLQEAGFFELLTVAETLQTFAAFHRKSVRVAQILERMGLVERRRALVRDLSGGQKQRLSVALALVNDPRIVFLDEPTTGLDPQARRNLWDVIREIRTEGRTLIVTTHYMEEAEELCDRVAIMDHGRILALDRPDRLIASHAPGAVVVLEGVASGVEAAVGALVDGDGAGTSEPHDGGPVLLRRLPGVSEVFEPENGPESVALRTTEAAETLRGLIELQQAGRVNFRNLRVEQPTLEDVFLSLTGRGLRE